MIETHKATAKRSKITVRGKLGQYPWTGALALHLGDDDKDKEAVDLIKARGGIAVVVAPAPRETEADMHLESPQAARHWLETLLVDRG